MQLWSVVVLFVCLTIIGADNFREDVDFETENLTEYTEKCLMEKKTSKQFGEFLTF